MFPVLVFKDMYGSFSLSYLIFKGWDIWLLMLMLIMFQTHCICNKDVKNFLMATDLICISLICYHFGQ